MINFRPGHAPVMESGYSQLITSHMIKHGGGMVLQKKDGGVLF